MIVVSFNRIPYTWRNERSFCWYRDEMVNGDFAEKQQEYFLGIFQLRLNKKYLITSLAI